MDEQAALERIKFTPVPPLGKVKTWGHINRGNLPHYWGEFEIDDYPVPCVEAERLAGLRRQLGLWLGEAARLLGISPSRMSDLEHGRATADWTMVEQLLRGNSEYPDSPS